mgnify:CR=1 FL=1
MRLSDASVVFRPRPGWEAMDLGVLLSQRHRRLLMTSWAIVTLPVFALLSLLLWDSPSLADLATPEPEPQLPDAGHATRRPRG